MTFKKVKLRELDLIFYDEKKFIAALGCAMIIHSYSCYQESRTLYLLDDEEKSITILVYNANNYTHICAMNYEES